MVILWNEALLRADGFTQGEQPESLSSFLFRADPKVGVPLSPMRLGCSLEGRWAMSRRSATPCFRPAAGVAWGSRAPKVCSVKFKSVMLQGFSGQWLLHEGA